MIPKCKFLFIFYGLILNGNTNILPEVEAQEIHDQQMIPRSLTCVESALLLGYKALAKEKSSLYETI